MPHHADWAVHCTDVSNKRTRRTLMQGLIYLTYWATVSFMALCFQPASWTSLMLLNIFLIWSADYFKSQIQLPLFSTDETPSLQRVFIFLNDSLSSPMCQDPPSGEFKLRKVHTWLLFGFRNRHQVDVSEDMKAQTLSVSHTDTVTSPGLQRTLIYIDFLETYSNLTKATCLTLTLTLT